MIDRVGDGCSGAHVAQLSNALNPNGVDEIALSGTRITSTS
jgi:hypothetical protein